MGREMIEIGKRGEEIAVALLKRNNYRITAVNFKTPFGEIDIVAEKGGFTVFVEVKTRVSSSLGPPSLSVTRAKERHIIRNAVYYLKKHRLLDVPCRIDVVSVKLDRGYMAEKTEIIENAIQA